LSHVYFFDDCIDCDVAAANCILNSDQSTSAIEACFATFDDCLLEFQCIPPNGNGMVGGTLIPIDTTAVLLAGAQMTAYWMIPIIVAGIGFAIVIARKF